MAFISADNVKVLTLLLILLNPFALENLSYRFDCIFMYFALSIPFLVFSIPESCPAIVNFSIVFIITIIVLSLYQPAIGIVPVLLLIEIYFALSGNKKKIVFNLWRAGGLCAGAVIYKFFIANYFVDSQDWRNEASHIVDVNLDSINAVYANILNASQYLVKYMLGDNLTVRILCGVIVSLMCIYAIYSFFKKSTFSLPIKLAGGIFVLLLPVAAFVSTFLPMMLLENLSIRSRLFIAFGGFLFFIFIMLFHLFPQKSRVIAILLIFYALHQYTSVYSYGNALKSQNEYQKYMVYHVVHDLETLNKDGEFQTVSFVGGMPRSRQVQMLCSKKPLFDQIVPVYFDNNTWIGGAWVYHYMQNDIVIVGETQLDLQIIDSGEPVLDNSIYSCYTASEKIIVVFH